MMKTLETQNLLFSIYQGKHAIQLRLGCDDYPDLRVISTSKSYESAYQVAQFAADSKQLPLEDYVPAEVSALV